MQIIGTVITFLVIIVQWVVNAQNRYFYVIVAAEDRPNICPTWL